LGICESKNNTEGAKILTQYSIEFDTSKTRAEDLLKELEKEDEIDEEGKGKRKLKKWRNKINKLAKSLNISPEEVEEKLLKEDQEKKQKEAEDKRKEIEKANQAEIVELARKEEIRRQVLEERKRIAQEEDEERRRMELQAREEKEDRIRA